MPRSKWWTLAIDIDACAAAETVPGSTKAFAFDVSSSGRRPGENRPGSARAAVSWHVSV